MNTKAKKSPPPSTTGWCLAYLPLAGILIATATPSVAHAAYELRNGAVAELRQGNPNTIFNGNLCLVGNMPANSSVKIMRTVLQFDLSSIAAGAEISSLSLQMTVGNTGGSTNATSAATDIGSFSLYALVPSGSNNNLFSETDATWNNWGAGDAKKWTTPGGDFSSLVKLSEAVVPATGALTNGAKYTFASTAEFVSVAQTALNNGLPIQLIIISETAEQLTSGQGFIRFASNDHATENWRPLLTINATSIPEPGTNAMITSALALVIVLGLRRFR
ncbi:DNRLRE domain-containing protein [Opitutaceae bacterium TAV4]|nr:DNRLRE domain-containing protein [Opitutaceae bacterium TAV4]RRJ99185.1 DNRLRE domain-containing protein [Opitutaceae bacterium TAV3]